MEQYRKIKSEYENYILFYRLGDFYEMFFEDAIKASKVLDLALTGRDCGEGQRAPMCGIPYHAAQPYIGKLIKAGLKVAICEQVEDPKAAKGIVRRDVIRVITQGTVIESDLLREDRNNYLCTLVFFSGGASLAFSDVSCASLCATELSGGDDLADKIINEISAYCPSEIITNESVDKYPKLKQFIYNRLGASVSAESYGRFDYTPCAQAVREQFGEAESSEYIKNTAIVCAVGGALSYLRDVHKAHVPNIKDLKIYGESQYVEIDAGTRRSLELYEGMRSGEKKGSLLWVLDKTKTSPGARLLTRFVGQPLTDIAEITRRQNAVGELKDDFMKRSNIGDLLDSVLDMERLLTKVICKTANARDLYGICSTLRVLPDIKSELEGSSSGELKRIYEGIDSLKDLRELLESALGDNLPLTVREGGMIREGYNESLDLLRAAVTDGKGWLERIASEEREKTGIRTLKIGYNRVFGYYIEVSKSFMNQVPDTYIRKQTLANCERYITEELKIKEAEMLGAKDRICALEYDIFTGLCDRVSECAPTLRRISSMLSLLDVYCSLAEVAEQNRFVCPSIEADEVIDIKGGRHPVVEKFMTGGECFIPNDTYLDTADRRTMLITGPNMAGKSTYMRQVALITIMAQIGSFVPADSARIGVVDKIFTRVGASDDLAGGQSTFMLEMNEVAYILKNATKKSLIIYDEVGRGTSTYDGMSVARAVVEYTNGKKIGARTMFATHYHELTSLENEYEGIVNYSIAAKKKGDDIIFLRKIVKGSTDESFGIEVAKLAGVPSEVISRAKNVLRSLEEGEVMKKAKHQKEKAPVREEVSLETLANARIADMIRETTLDTLTPIEALGLLYKLKGELI